MIDSKLESELREFCISLGKFLETYYGISSKSIYNKKLSHKDIKELIPSTKRVKFETLVKNKKDLYDGSVVIVADSYGNIAPYMTPEIKEISNLNICDVDISKNQNREEKLESTIISEDLSRYELVLLCRYFKKNRRNVDYRIASKLLKIKKDEQVKVYKKEKINLMMKGRESYEEY